MQQTITVMASSFVEGARFVIVAVDENERFVIERHDLFFGRYLLVWLTHGLSLPATAAARLLQDLQGRAGAGCCRGCRDA